MKSIEKLRSCGVRSNQIGMRFVDENELQRIADEIEAEWQDSYDAMCLEIKRGYMKLPVDADGVPIHVGDEVEWINGNGKYTVCGVGELVALRTHESNCFTMNSERLRHVKTRTLEDIVQDAIQYGYSHGKAGMDISEQRDKYADEIRELFGGDER